MSQPAAESAVRAVILEDDGSFPNNPRPLLLYAGVFPGDPAVIEAVFTRNGWPSAWRNGVYPYHHYHSSAHEALGVYSGSAQVLFGGPAGAVETLRAGDVVVIPAGVGHRCLEASADFRVVGAYPRGQTPDMCYGKPGERPGADRRLATVSEPGQDPVEGLGGRLISLWRSAAGRAAASYPEGAV
jgi:uncharacterized protein YjlB